MTYALFSYPFKKPRSCLEPAHKEFDRAKEIFSSSLRGDQQQHEFGLG